MIYVFSEEPIRRAPSAFYKILQFEIVINPLGDSKFSQIVGMPMCPRIQTRIIYKFLFFAEKSKFLIL